jgi:hypothetical protein
MKKCEWNRDSESCLQQAVKRVERHATEGERAELGPLHTGIIPLNLCETHVEDAKQEFLGELLVSDLVA